MKHAVQAHGLSERRARRLIGMDRSSCRLGDGRESDASLRARLRDLVAERRRFGYRRLAWLLWRAGHAAATGRTESAKPIVGNSRPVTVGVG